MKQDSLQDWEEFDRLSYLLIGDNVGENCSCMACERNRRTFKNYVRSLLQDQKKELIRKMKTSLCLHIYGDLEDLSTLENDTTVVKIIPKELLALLEGKE